jgi:diguanylate cyclase (GGDEF)-like protein/PAS domain S-box-containing protein
MKKRARPLHEQPQPALSVVAAMGRWQGAERRTAQQPLIDRLSHDLQVHQIELEMQNESLRAAQLALQAARDRYADLYDQAPVGYFTVGDDGLVVEGNRCGAKLLGIAHGRLEGQRFSAFVAPESLTNWDRFMVSTLRDGGEPGRIELRMKGALGESFRARIDGVRAQPSGGRPCLRITLIDIEQTKRLEAELRLAAAAFNTQEGIMITSADGVIERVNQAFTRITGYSAEEAIGQRGSLMHSGLQDASFYEDMWQRLLRDGQWAGELWNRRKSGEVYPQWLSITEVAGDNGNPLHYVGTMVDITERKEREREIAQLAFFDPLTDLPNRRLMKDRLQQALSACQRSKREGALMFIDIDRFKQINDSLGHALGDALLRQAAKRLVACVREGDTVARLGGDEFVVMLPPSLSGTPHSSVAQATAIGEKILAAMRLPYEVGGAELQSSASIGITLFGDESGGVDEMLKRADQAMYQAKAAGRDALRFFDEAQQAKLQGRAAIEADLRVAMTQGQLVLHYQPAVDTAGRVVGAEALMRWQHPQHGLMLPDEFIGVAEDSGLIIPMGLWALQTACAQLEAWASDAVMGQLNVSVNVCAMQLLDGEFVSQVLGVLKRHHVQPARLKLELTESVLLHDVDDTIAKMRELKSRGVGFSLDDFGTGYSSLAYLKRLPLDQLKIDRSFVSDMVTKPHDAAIVHTIIDLGRSLGLTVISEGVETRAQRELLTHMGCQAFQGRLFGMPMAAGELRAMAVATQPEARVSQV